jgi:plasmid stabilization system protein ParE
MGRAAHVERRRRPDNRWKGTPDAAPREISTLFDDIRQLLDAPDQGDGAPSLARVEETLTTGYAHALALDAERWRLERRLDEVVAHAAQGGDQAAAELVTLTTQLSSADGELEDLRAMLRPLRLRAAQLRRAQPQAY